MIAIQLVEPGDADEEKERENLENESHYWYQNVTKGNAAAVNISNIASKGVLPGMQEEIVVGLIWDVAPAAILRQLADQFWSAIGFYRLADSYFYQKRLETARSDATLRISHSAQSLATKLRWIGPLSCVCIRILHCTLTKSRNMGFVQNGA